MTMMTVKVKTVVIMRRRRKMTAMTTMMMMMMMMRRRRRRGTGRTRTIMIKKKIMRRKRVLTLTLATSSFRFHLVIPAFLKLLQTARYNQSLMALVRTSLQWMKIQQSAMNLDWMSELENSFLVG